MEHDQNLSDKEETMVIISKLLRKLHVQEQGQLLMLTVMIIFLISSMVVVPLMNFMMTGISSSKNQSLRAQEIYAAEAGVNDAIWKIQYVADGIPKGPFDPPYSYSITDGINDRSVDLIINYIDQETYRIHASATSPTTGHVSTIDSDLDARGGGLDFSFFTDMAMTSPGDIDTHQSDVIDGDIWTGGIFDGDATVTGTVTEAPVEGWPTEELLRLFFGYQVDMSSPYSLATIPLPGQSGPLYVYTASDPTRTYTLTGSGTLNGVLYIDGNLYINNTARVSLGGNSIFCTGNITTSPQAVIQGPGAIIALGDLYFAPQVGNAYLFVMSVYGEVNFQPQGDFYGSVSGNALINLQPGCTLTWIDPGVGQLDLPGHYTNIKGIKTWTIH